METSGKKLQELLERVAKLRQNPAVTDAMKKAEPYIAKALARLNEFLAQLSKKK
jgi:hypothetical protein